MAIRPANSSVSQAAGTEFDGCAIFRRLSFGNAEMKRNLIRNLGLLCLIVIAGACGSYGGKSESKDQKDVAPELTLRKGSGRQCPAISGDYVCSATDEEQDAGRDSYVIKIQQVLDAENKTRFTIMTPEDTETLIADGEIHRLRPNDSNVEYTVDCQSNGISWHIAANQGINVKTTVRLTNRTSATLEFEKFANGELTRGRRRCSYDPGPYSPAIQ